MRPRLTGLQRVCLGRTAQFCLFFAIDCKRRWARQAPKRTLRQQRSPACATLVLLGYLLATFAVVPSDAKAQAPREGTALSPGGNEPVAIVDLAGTAASNQLATLFAEVLFEHPRLTAISDTAVAAALLTPLEPQRERHLVAAQQALTQAETALAQFDLRAAIAHGQAGITGLAQGGPSEAATQALAELAFVIGRAELTAKNSSEAQRWFALCARVAPRFAPEPARYVSSVLSAYAAAQREGEVRIPLTIDAQGEVTLDGAGLGYAPLTTTVAPGRHAVYVEALDYAPTMQIVNVEAPRSSVALRGRPLNTNEMLAALRRRLAQAPDAAIRGATMSMIAARVGVRAAIIIAPTISPTNGSDALDVYTWRNAAPGFSKPTAATLAQPRTIVDQLAPPPAPGLPPVAPPLPAVSPTPTTPQRPWYQLRWVQASIVSSIVLGAITTAMILGSEPANRRIDDHFEWK